MPVWASFQVIAAARYLGIMLGPAASQTQWTLTIEKWKQRSQLIAATGAAASISARLYNVRAVPVLSYISQLRPPPLCLQKLERQFLGKVLHVPGNVFGARELLNLQEFNGPSFVSVVALTAAIAARTATKTITTWPVLLGALVDTAAEFLPARDVIMGRLSQPFWDEIPIVSFLLSSSSLASIPPPHLCSSRRIVFPLPFSVPSIPPSVAQGLLYESLLKAW